MQYVLILGLPHQEHNHRGRFIVKSGNITAFLVAQTVKNQPAMQAFWAPSLGREDSLEKEMAIQSSILAWRIPWTEQEGYSPWGRKEMGTTEQSSAVSMKNSKCSRGRLLEGCGFPLPEFSSMLLLSHFSRVQLCATP